VQCECGCGWEGEDEVAQWLIEEAVMLKGRVVQAKEVREASRKAEQQARADAALRDLVAGR